MGEWTEYARFTNADRYMQYNLNDKENDLLKKKEQEIRSISGKLVEIHNSVYSD